MTSPRPPAVWAVHFARFERLLAEGTIILAGSTLGTHNTGVAVFEAPDEDAARRIMEDDPVVSDGFARGVAPLPGVADAGAAGGFVTALKRPAQAARSGGPLRRQRPPPDRWGG